MVLNRRLLAAALLGLLLCANVPALFAAPAHVLKFATLAPEGTAWMEIVEAWGERLEQESEGRLTLKIYPGGIQGDEPDVLKKMRFGQLQGGAFSGYGIGRIHSPARVLEMPFLFDTLEEVDLVRQEYMPAFRQGFLDRGYVLLGWMEVGPIHFFSHEPIASLDDLRRRKIWLWQGDPLAEAWFRAAGISPVPLSITDVYTSLSTGLIDTVYATPLAATALQWYTRVNYMTGMPMANGIGALVVSRRFFDRLPRDLQELLSRTADETASELTALTREESADGIAVLEREGIEVVLNRGDLDPAEVERIAAHAAGLITGSNYIPLPLFERTRQFLHDHRQRTQ